MNDFELEIWKARHLADSKANNELLLSETKERKGLMTEEQEWHLADIQRSVKARLDEKYRKGQAEHGGNVWERNPVLDIDGEVIDLLVYHNVLQKRDALIETLIIAARTDLASGDFGDVSNCLDAIYELVHKAK